MGLAELQVTGRHRLDLYASSLEREIDKYASFSDHARARARRAAAAGRPQPALADRVATATWSSSTSAPARWRSMCSTRAAWSWPAATGAGPTATWAKTCGFGPYFPRRSRPAAGASSASAHARRARATTWPSALGVRCPGHAGGRGGRGRPAAARAVPGPRSRPRRWWRTRRRRDPRPRCPGTGKLTTLQPLDPATRRAFDGPSRTTGAPRRWACIELERLEHGARLVRLPRVGPERVSMFPVAGKFLAQTQVLPGTPSNITVFSQQEEVRGMAASRATLAGAGTAFLCILALMLNERRRHLKNRLAAREALQQAHDELDARRPNARPTCRPPNCSCRPRWPSAPGPNTLRAAQDELVQAGKLAVIGQLATGIAHELNQPLAALRTLSGNARKLRAATSRPPTATWRASPSWSTAWAASLASSSPSRASPRAGRRRYRCGVRSTTRCSCFEQRCQRAGVLVNIELTPPELLAVRCQPARTGAGQPGRQCARCDGRPADAQAGHQRRAARRADRAAGARPRARPGRRGAQPSVRALLHHQGGWQRPRTRAGDARPASWPTSAAA